MSPAHIGIIMDGNGRWAAQRHLPRSAGHNEGLKAAKRIVAAAVDFGVSAISLFIFSTENWKRATDEVGHLMFLIKDHLVRELDFYRSRNIRILHSGNPEGLPEDIQREISAVVKATSGYDSLTLNLCINYGGRDEILRAFSAFLTWRDTAPSVSKNDEGLTEIDFRRFLYQPSLPDPDLIIRTAGEKRLSNFLLWGSAYAEFHFSEKLWPDWSREDLEYAIQDYESRQRLFGGKR